MGSAAQLIGFGAELRPEQFVATGGLSEKSTTTARTAGLNNVFQSRTRHRIGYAGFRTLAPVFSNYWVTMGNEESPLGAVTDLQASILMNGVLKQVTWGGATSTTMTAGQAMLIADPLRPSDFGLTATNTAGVNFYITYRMIVGDGDIHRQGDVQTPLTQPAGEPANSILGILSSDSNNQVMTGVALDTAGVASITYPCPPIAFIGRTQGTSISLLAFGDSLMNGHDDDGRGGAGDGSNGGGMLARACYTQQVPFTNSSRSGAAIRDYTTANSAKRDLLIPYATHIITAWGTNDLLQARTSAQAMEDIRTKLWAKMTGKHVEAILLVPVTTSTNDWIDAAGQTVNSAFVVGGQRDIFNAALATAASSSEIQGVLDLNTAAIEDPANPSKWASDGTEFYATDDGIHRSVAAAIDSASVLGTRFATWVGV